MTKVVNPPSLKDVNDHLLTRLDTLIQDASPEELLDITEALAKFNSSIRNNDQFGKPETAEEKLQREQADVISSMLNGQEAQEAEIV